METVIVLLIIFAMIGAASYKLYKDKKNNVKCSGCPSGCSNKKCSAEQKSSK